MENAPQKWNIPKFKNLPVKYFTRKNLWWRKNEKPEHETSGKSTKIENVKKRLKLPNSKIVHKTNRWLRKNEKQKWKIKKTEIT